MEVQALIDSSAQFSFMNMTFICICQYNLSVVNLPLSQRAILQNTDGMLCRDSLVTEKCHLLLVYNECREWVRLLVSNMGTDDVVLEHNWVQPYNPKINWIEQMVEMI